MHKEKENEKKKKWSKKGDQTQKERREKNDSRGDAILRQRSKRNSLANFFLRFFSSFFLFLAHSMFLLFLLSSLQQMNDELIHMNASRIAGNCEFDFCRGKKIARHFIITKTSTKFKLNLWMKLKYFLRSVCCFAAATFKPPFVNVVVQVAHKTEKKRYSVERMWHGEERKKENRNNNNIAIKTMESRWKLEEKKENFSRTISLGRSKLFFFSRRKKIIKHLWIHFHSAIVI